ncbi:MAG: esterase-like activity of phytase family protein, partial [Sulfitobacter sp.]
MIRLTLLLIFLSGSSGWADPVLQFKSAVSWTLDTPWFGGWSSIELGSNGTELTIISDRGQILRADIERSSGGQTQITVRNTVRLKNERVGQSGKKSNDAEGLAIGPGGRAFISFEHAHRIMQVDLDTGKTCCRIVLPFTRNLQPNKGIEALAINPDGLLHAIAERTPKGSATFPLYRYANDSWQIIAQITKRGPFLPVGADFDAAGRLWLLERAVTPVGFRNRIRLLTLTADTVTERTILTTLPGR